PEKSGCDDEPGEQRDQHRTGARFIGQSTDDRQARRIPAGRLRRHVDVTGRRNIGHLARQGRAAHQGVELLGNDRGIDVEWIMRLGARRTRALAGHPEIQFHRPFTLSSAANRKKRGIAAKTFRSEEHTSELQSRENLVCRLLLEKKKKTIATRSAQLLLKE